jgi:hypothetical protein
MSSVEDTEAKRAKRKADLAEKREAQYAIDLAALDAAEVEHGDSNVTVQHISFEPGLPTLCVARMPSDGETKRYRARLRPPDGKMGDPVQAAIEISASTVVYPDKETFEKMCAARPNLAVDLGAAAANLTRGREAAEGKG